MILMLEVKNYPPKDYINVKAAKKILGDALEVDLSSVPLYKVHKILQRLRIPSKQVKLDSAKDKLTTLYYRGTLLSMKKQNCEDALHALSEAENILFKETGLKANVFKSNKTTNVKQKPQEIETQEIPWDETNMDYVRWQLDQHINDSKIPLNHLIKEEYDDEVEEAKKELERYNKLGITHIIHCILGKQSENFIFSQGKLVPRVCAEGGPKAIWFSNNNKHTEYPTWAFSLKITLDNIIKYKLYCVNKRISFAYNDIPLDAMEIVDFPPLGGFDGLELKKSDVPELIEGYGSIVEVLNEFANDSYLYIDLFKMAYPNISLKGLDPKVKLLKYW